MQQLDKLGVESQLLMKERYKNEIQNKMLKIIRNQDVRSIEFVEDFDISQLFIYDCKNMVPTLNNKQISYFHAQDCDMKSIEGLKLENLQVLCLFDNKIVQTNTIRSFSQLRELNLGYNKNVDISPLQYMTGLTKLNLAACNVNSAAPLKSLTNLEELELFINPLKDIAPLVYLRKLSKLNIGQCGLRKAKELKDLNLSELHLTANKGVDTAVLKNFKNLRILHLNYCGLQKIPEVSSLVNLQELVLSSNEKLNLEPVKNLTLLAKLKIDFCKIKSIAVLQKLTRLEELDLSNNKEIRDFVLLQHLVRLKMLRIEQCDLRSVAMLLPLVNLQELSLGKNNIVRVNSLERLASLRHLNVENNLIVDFSALKKHQNFGSFKIQNQRQPSIAQVKQANAVSCIDAPVTLLRNMNLMKNKLKARKIIILNLLNKQRNNAALAMQLVVAFIQQSNQASQ
ncbi:leucine-rich_repeat domain-containing protein [Hexamita inflata]|uniref:Leucine-rich repeat domain-containing protein n=1 Tax=Hexamita inflata TaxID=28002 RepID=A0AA86VGC8_9EUKA|nr:leucine-rich repeat domain-containing protein [Hexamita inflata]